MQYVLVLRRPSIANWLPDWKMQHALSISVLDDVGEDLAVVRQGVSSSPQPSCSREAGLADHTKLLHRHPCELEEGDGWHKSRLKGLISCFKNEVLNIYSVVSETQGVVMVPVLQNTEADQRRWQAPPKYTQNVQAPEQSWSIKFCLYMLLALLRNYLLAGSKRFCRTGVMVVFIVFFSVLFQYFLSVVVVSSFCQ